MMCSVKLDCRFWRFLWSFCGLWCFSIESNWSWKNVCLFFNALRINRFET